MDTLATEILPRREWSAIPDSDVYNQHNPPTRPQNFMNWMGTTREGHNVAIRIMSVGDDGKAQMQILRKIARGNISLFSENHVAPLWREVSIGDLTFALFPFIGYNLENCYGLWARNSVGDIIDMIMQALEV